MARRLRNGKVVVGLGLALAVLLSSCFGGGESHVVTTQPTPQPLYEPAGSAGLDSFFPLSEQIEMAVAGGTTQTPVAGAPSATGTPPPAGTPADPSNLTPVGVSRPSDQQIKSGLYGGTVENTCNAEQLIQYLLDNPSKGQVWADVQGISFDQLPTYINSLRPRVLASDVQVLNHGYDKKGHAIPIVSTLAAGTAVFVDQNGDVRARCYCGNPIVPYDPPAYQPPKCLSYYAVVYVSPSERTVIQGVPRFVQATNNVSKYESVNWTEITWGGATGWVRTDHAQTRYCKPIVKVDCVAFAQVTLQPNSTTYVGELTNAFVSVYVANADGWTLIGFGGYSGWVPTNTMGGQGCTYQVSCVSASNGSWSEPGYRGVQYVAPNQPQRLEYTGHSYIDTTGTYLEAYLTSPAPTRIAWVKDTDVSPRVETDCAVSLRCSRFDVDAAVYRESTGSDSFGVLWFSEVQIATPPTNGRYGIQFGGITGWVDISDLQGYGCDATIACISILAKIYNSLPDSSGDRPGPQGPITADFTGRIAVTDAKTFREFTSPQVSGGPGWLDGSVGYMSIDYGLCNLAPVCEKPYVPTTTGGCGWPPTCPGGDPIPTFGGCCPTEGIYETSPDECQRCPEFVTPSLTELVNDSDAFPNDCCPGQYFENNSSCVRQCIAVGEGALYDSGGQIIGQYGPGDPLLIGGQATVPGVGIAIEATVGGLTGYIDISSGRQLCTTGSTAPTPVPVASPTPTPVPVASPTPTPVPVASPTPTPAPVASPTPTPTRTTVAPTGCTAPQVELTLNGSTRCQSEAVCLSQGFDWEVTDGKCVQLPPCKRGFGYLDNSGACRPLCESGYEYSSEFGICVTTGFGCPYPELDFLGDGYNFCFTRTDCVTNGYYVLPPNCQYEPSN